MSIVYSQGLVFQGLEQLIPTFLDDFPGGVVMVIQRYGIYGDWRQYFDTQEQKENGSVACVRQGSALNLKAEMEYGIYSPTCWIEKLFPMKKHRKLALEQWEVLQGLNIASEYKDIPNVRYLYMTLDQKFRNLDYGKKKGGCGLIHWCPNKTCGELGCYEHLDFDDQTKFDLSQLKYSLVCNCGYKLDSLIGVRSTFQGAIPCFLCSGNSNASLGVNALKFLIELYGKQQK